MYDEGGVMCIGHQRGGSAQSAVRPSLDDLELVRPDPLGVARDAAQTRVHYEFDEATSLRASAGLRGTFASELMGVPASLSLTGRYWNESEGEGSATITTASGSSADLVDEFVGDFSEVVASLNLYSGDGGVSGFVNLGGKFGDDYQAADGSIGVRVRW